ncbi:GAF domain-containing protein [Desulfovibrio sp. OttesenSCG-928-F07]|nr:GAF domain-containing protein [Desulfovibrio sp. OttesenSCG-928-F07]
MAGKDKSYFRALYEVVSVINSSLEPQVVLQKIAEQLTVAMEAKACSIRLLDRTGSLLLASAAHGLSRGYVRKGKVEVKKSQLDTEVISSGNPVYIEDVSRDTRFQYPEAAKEEGLTSVLVAPLKVEGKVIGVVRVYTKEKYAFNEDDREFIMAVTHVAAIAIENARLHQALKSDYELLTEYNYQIFED